MAAYSKTLVILANSWKHSGRCLAGKEVVQRRLGAWVRPTSDRPNGELNAVEQRLEAGSQPALLDIVEVPLHRPAPAGFQAENHLIAPGAGWVKRGRLPWSSLHQAVDDCDCLWINGYSSGGGCHDRIPAHRLDGLGSSLLFIGPVRVDLHVMGSKVRARFVYRRTVHDLSVTDPRIRDAYAPLMDGWYRIDEAFVCVSLAPVWHGYAYKLAAGIITRNAG